MKEKIEKIIKELMRRGHIFDTREEVLYEIYDVIEGILEDKEQVEEKSRITMICPFCKTKQPINKRCKCGEVLL